MKTAIEYAFDRIELSKDIKPDIHWEMLKNDCLLKEQSQLEHAFKYGHLLKWPEIFSKKIEKIEFKLYYEQHYNQIKQHGTANIG